MLPMAEDTDGLDTDKESEEKENSQFFKIKGKALPRPPNSNYKKSSGIRSTNSVRNVWQRLRNNATKNKWKRICTNDEKQSSDVEENFVDSNIEVPKKCGVEDINAELEKARKRIQDRMKKTRNEKETEETHVQNNPVEIINKENGRQSENYTNVQLLRSPDRSLESLPFIDEVNNLTPVSTCQPRQSPISAFALTPTTRFNSSQSNKSLVTSISNAGRYHVLKTLSAFSPASESNLEQDIFSSSTSKCIMLVILKTVLSKQEELLRNFNNLDHKLDLIIDHVRTGEDVKKPEGWPTLPLPDMNAFYEWELFLQNGDNYDFAVSHFSIVAGRGHHEGEMATAICKKIFSSKVASQLNWAGAEFKKGIKTLKCDACGKQYKENFSKSKVTGSVSTWLRSHSKRSIQEK
ncbi:hypothetical protein PUN28_008250 [Cardiocondyla obscurior]|uniref:DUF4806 domain-containing protein n=1 Tax=Cardiocondyla obscurior TaxID=286306 RepID=A0AAW2FYB4_9HYME